MFNKNVEQIFNNLRVIARITINFIDGGDNTLLHLSVLVKKRQAFNYFIQVDIYLDATNFRSFSVQTSDDYYLKKLLSRGCCVN